MFNLGKQLHSVILLEYRILYAQLTLFLLQASKEEIQDNFSKWSITFQIFKFLQFKHKFRELFLCRVSGHEIYQELGLDHGVL